MVGAAGAFLLHSIGVTMWAVSNVCHGGYSSTSRVKLLCPSCVSTYSVTRVTAFFICLEDEMKDKNRIVIRNLDAPESEVRLYKQLLCRSARIFKKDKERRKPRPSLTSHDHRRKSVLKRREYKICNIVNQEHDMELIMTNNLETKEDIYRFFISKNVSPMLKCIIMA